MVILSGSSNIPLAEAIGRQCAAPLLTRTIRKFPNGEISVQLQEGISGQAIVLLQSLQEPIHEHLMEVLLLADAAKRAGAPSIIGVIPWLAYSKQDRIFGPGESLSAQVIAKALCSAPIDRFFLMDLHSIKELDFFSIPTVHLTLVDAFASALKPQMTKQSVVISPDEGGIPRSEAFAAALNLPVLLIEKKRDQETGDAQAISLSGPVEGKQCLIFDDLISTGSTVVADASFLKQKGAASVTFCATHGLFARGFDLFKGVVDKILVSDSIPLLQGIPPFVQVIPSASTIASALGKE